MARRSELVFEAANMPISGGRGVPRSDEALRIVLLISLIGGSGALSSSSPNSQAARMSEGRGDWLGRPSPTWGPRFIVERGSMA